MTKDLFRIGVNTSAQIVARSVTAVSTLIVTLLVTRNLSQNDWGIFVTITSYVALFYLIADFGLNGVVVRELEERKKEIGYYFNNLISLRFILSIVAIFVALSVLSFTGHSSTIKFGIIIFLISILTLALFNSAAVVFQSKLRYDQMAIADISGALVTLTLAYLFIISDFSIIFVVVSFIAGGIVRSFISLTLSSAYTEGFKLEFDIKLWKKLLIVALPIGLTLLFSQLVANVDKQIIYLANYNPGLNINNELAVGFYGLAYRIFEFGIIIPAFFVNSIYPLLLKDKNISKNLLRNNFFKYAKLLIGLGMIFTIIVFLLSPFVVKIFGDYASSSGILQILSIGYIFFFITPLLMWTIISLGKEKILPFVFGFAFLFNLAANLFFVPRFGFSSAAVITVITEIIILVWLMIVLMPLLKSDFK